MAAPDSRPFRAALWGHPVGHSRSKQMFDTYAAAQPRAIEFELVDLPGEALEDAVAAFRSGSWDGVAITLPHKQALAAAVDRLDRAAQLSGAVNIVRREADGSLSGFNTDGVGFAAGVDEFYPGRLAACRGAALLGAGGGALGVGAELSDRGLELTVVTRDPERARERFASLDVICFLDWSASEAIAALPLLVQATPIGMTPLVAALPPVEPSLFRSGQLVVDLIYSPWQTALLNLARAGGAETLNGWPMLVHQAAYAAELWLGPGHRQPFVAAQRKLEPRDPRERSVSQ